MIYIKEAHPVDLNDKLRIIPQVKQQTELQERIRAAEMMMESSPSKLKENCPMLVDLMSNEAGKVYACQPNRVYVIQNGKVVYDGGIGPYGYDLEKLEKWLNQNA